MMAIKHEFSYVVPEGEKNITLNDWVESTLSPEENQHYIAARGRQHAIRQTYIDQGLLIIDKSDTSGETYIWRDEEAERNNKPCDPKWLEFFNRHAEATGIKLIIKKVEV